MKIIQSSLNGDVFRFNFLLLGARSFSFRRSRLVLDGGGFRGIIQRNEGPQLGSDLVLLLTFIETERKNCEIVEDSDVVGEDVNDEVVDAFVFSKTNVLTGIVLLASPIENDSILLISERELENEYLILSSDFCLVLIERLTLADVALVEVIG